MQTDSERLLSPQHEMGRAIFFSQSCPKAHIMKSSAAGGWLLEVDVPIDRIRAGWHLGGFGLQILSPHMTFTDQVTICSFTLFCWILFLSQRLSQLFTFQAYTVSTFYRNYVFVIFRLFSHFFFDIFPDYHTEQRQRTRSHEVPTV